MPLSEDADARVRAGFEASLAAIDAVDSPLREAASASSPEAVAVYEGSVSQFWLSYLLKKAGMSMSDIEVQNMTADDAASAFIAGHVPVAVTWEPNLTMVKQKGSGKVLVDSGETPGVIVDVVALDCDVIEKQPEDVKALVAGLYKAVEFTRSNPEKAHEIMAKGVGGRHQQQKCIHLRGLERSLKGVERVWPCPDSV